MKPIGLIAGFMARVDRSAREGNELLSRAQIRRIGSRFVAELFEKMGAADLQRDSWIKDARATVDGAKDALFLRQLPAGFHPEAFALRLAVDVLKELQRVGLQDAQLGCWCSNLELATELKPVAAVLNEICDAYPEIGDRYYIKVEIVRDLATVPALSRPQRSPGAGLTAFGYAR